MERDSDTIRQEAEHWFVRRRDGACPPAEEAEFRRWLERSEAHARAYAASARAWEELQGLQASPRMQAIAAAAMRATAPSRPRTLRLWKPLLLAASVAAVAVVGVLRFLPQDTEASAPVAYATALGEQRTEQLADGTRLTLNTETVLQVTYSDARRAIALERGEAMFEVAPDPARPFVVTAADGTVTALGTRFQVRAQDGAVAVTLLEGSVEVAREAQHETQRLAPGDRAEYRAAAGGIAVQQVDPAAATAWMQGRLDFRATPLAEAVAEANRYSARKLRLGDPALAALPVSGNFSTGDSIGIATAFATVFPVRIDSATETEIVLAPAR